MIRTALHVLIALIVSAPVRLFAQPRLVLEATSAHEVDSAFALPGHPQGGTILTYTHADRTAVVYSVASGRLSRSGRAKISGQLYGAAVLGEKSEAKIAYGCGMGRGDLTPPLRIYLADQWLQNSRLIFEQPTERSQSTFLERDGDGLLLNYFTSKYMTALVRLSPADTRWTAAPLGEVRLGSAIARAGDRFAIGRPYGDIQGQDGDVLLLGGEGARLTLPSYRGVSSIAAVQMDSDPEAELLIGDGWHQNYGQFAQARVSVLDRDAESGRYRLDHLGTIAEGAWSVSRFLPLDGAPKAPVLAVTNNSLVFFDPQQSGFAPVVLAVQKDSTKVFDAVLVGGPKPYVGVVDGKLYLYRLER